MHSGGFDLTKPTYTRLEDMNLIRHRGERYINLTGQLYLGRFVGAAYITVVVPLRKAYSKVEKKQKLKPRRSRGVTRASGPEPQQENKIPFWYRSLGQ